MNPRVHLTAVAFGLAFFLALTGWLVLGAPGTPVDEEPLDATGYAGAIRPTIPAQQLNGLVDERGRNVRLPGEVTVVTFAYTQCEDACPTTVQQIRAALDDLEDPPPAFVISVDPRLDTAPRAKTFLADQGVLGRISFLTGPQVALERQWRTYGIQPQTDLDDHSVSVVLLDHTGRQRIGFPLDELTPRRLVRDITTLRAQAASSPTTSKAS